MGTRFPPLLPAEGDLLEGHLVGPVLVEHFPNVSNTVLYQ